MDDETKQIIENLDNKALDRVIEEIGKRNAPMTIRAEVVKLATKMTALYSINSMQETLCTLLEIPRSAELHRATAGALAGLIKVKKALLKDIQNWFDEGDDCYCDHIEATPEGDSITED